MGTIATKVQIMPFRSRQRPGLRYLWVRYGSLLLGALIVVSMVIITLLAPILSEHAPNKVAVLNRLVPPAWSPHGDPSYPLGTDQLGRDLWTRILYGGRTSMMVGAISVLASCLLGTVLGLIAGFYGGWVDTLIMRVTDVFMALPFILVALLVVAVLGPSLRNIIIVFSLTAWFGYARVARASALSLRERDWVDAARSIGVKNRLIIFRHILPHMSSALVVFASVEIARIITAEAALGFLGLGVPAPDPTWGNILSDGREYIQDAWWISTFPGLALVITVLGVNILGDALRDLLDPRLKL